MCVGKRNKKQHIHMYKRDFIVTIYSYAGHGTLELVPAERKHNRSICEKPSKNARPAAKEYASNQW